MIRTSIALAACAALMASAAHAGEAAARIGAVKGEVLVMGPGGLTPAKAGAALSPGQRIVARSGAVEVRFADGCKATVKAGGMATIAASSPCVGGPGVIQSGAASAQMGWPDWPVGAYFAGAGVLVIGGALLYGLTDPTEEDPISD